MLKKLLTLSFMLLFASSLMVAQSTHVLKANGDLLQLKGGKNFNEAIKSTRVTDLSGQSIKNIVLDGSLAPQGTIDTLRYTPLGTFNTNFGMFDGNVMLQYFVAPADLIINAAGFSTSDATGAAAATVSVKLMKLNWTYEELTGVPAPLHMGTYPSEGDGLGGIDAFGDNATGNWIDGSEGAYPLPPWADNVDPNANTFDNDLWSDGGFGWPVTAVASEFTDKVYQWVNMSDLGFNPTVAKDEVFAVVITHDGANPAFEDRIGFWSDNTIGVPGWKYYEEGRLAPGDGWYTRLYTWDFVVAVDLVGDRGPVVEGVTKLPTTLSTEARTVEATITDDNPSGGAAGIGSASIMFSTDDGATFTAAAMTGNGDLFSGEIPGQVPGTVVTYYVSATDVGGFETVSGSTTYQIFEATQSNLVIFDGQAESGYPSDYYFGMDDFTTYATIDFPHDVWAFGAYDNSLLDNYTNVFEITTGGPTSYQRDPLTTWLAADAGRNYFLAGEEWLGADNNFTNQIYEAGSFEYDILGVAASYNDITYAEDAGQGLTSLLLPVEGSALGGPLYDLFTLNGTDSLQYDPMGEISAASNWMDAFDAVNPANVDLMVETRGVDNVVSVENKACAVHNETANGNKVVFMTLDPISINSTPDYYWYGFSKVAIQVQAGAWFGIEEIVNVVDVRLIDDAIPSEFALAQNYPNPFNPSTVINYSLSQSADVSLAIYDVLGRKVADLVNESQKAGTYQVNWNGLSNSGYKVNSGVYFYTITAGDFVQTQKMMLMK